MRRVGKLTLIILVIVGAGLVVSVSAQKGKPGPPQPTALTLAQGINIITREIVASDRIRAWHSPEPPDATSFHVGWEEYGQVVPYLALGDVDGQGDNELILAVVYSIGSSKNPSYSVCVSAYKQGKAGPYYKTPCTAGEYVPETSPVSLQMSVAPFDLDHDGWDEVVLGTPNHVAVYKLTWNSDKWQFHRIAQADLAAVILPSETKPMERFSLTVGDVDRDGLPEIVCGGVIYTANAAGDEHSYLLIYNRDLNLMGYHHITGAPDLSSFVIDTVHGLQIGDTTGSGPEIWCSGWTNTATTNRYDQHVRSWRVDLDSEQNLAFQPGAGLDFPAQSRLGPRLSLGKLDQGGKDLLVLNNRGDASVEIYRINENSQAALVTSKTVPGASVQITTVMDGLLFLGGTVASTRRTPNGVYLEVSQLAGDSLATVWSNGELTGYQLWTFTVGHGMK